MAVPGEQEEEIGDVPLSPMMPGEYDAYDPPSLRVPGEKLPLCQLFTGFDAQFAV